MDEYKKLKIALRYFLIGKDYFAAVDALEFAAKYHINTRKDGVTPEFQHQVEIAHYTRTLLPSLLYPQETITAVLLHDVTEDYNIPHAEITERFGSIVGNAVELLDKNGKTSDHYFASIAESPIASIVKGGDRIHNLQTMHSAFSHTKQVAYAAEVENYFLPMIKSAKRLHAKQEPAYENIKHVLTSQLELVRRIHSNVNALTTLDQLC